MLFAAVLINADHAALEDTKYAFNCVGRHIISGKLFGRVMHRLVRGELGTQTIVEAAFVDM